MNLTLSANLSPAPRLEALTSLRFFAAFFVMAFHARARWLVGVFPAWADSILAAGYVSVGFFFVLSGFVLTYSHGKSSPLDLSRFWIARIARIYPVFLLGLALGALPAWMAFRKEQDFGPALGTFAWTGALNLSLLNAFSNRAGAWNAPAWSLSTEVFFYLAFPWLLAGIQKLKRPGLWFSAAAFLILACAGPLLACALEPELAAWKANVPSPATDRLETWIMILGYSPVGRVFDFLLGITLGRLFLTRVPRSGTPAFLSAAWVLLALSACGLVLQRSPQIPHLLLNNGLLNAAYAVVIYQLACGAGALSRLLQAPLLVFLGESSYALYILHVPVRDGLMAANRYLRIPNLVIFPGYAFAMVVFSGVVFRRLEKPARERIIKYFSKYFSRFPGDVPSPLGKSRPT